MIIQTAPAGRPRLAIMMHEHTALSGQFARAFGNDAFEPITPLDEVVYIIAHHDEGWAQLDRNPETDPKTDLPWNLVDTPARLIVPTSKGSPDFNERHHPYSGLLSSMHSWGLYNGRYGLSKQVLIDGIPAQDRPIADKMLEGELQRQDRLKSAIRQKPAEASWIEKDHLFQNYKHLQFCDTLALYFNRTHKEARGELAFESVPADAKRDATIKIRPRGGDTYELSPFPFVRSGAEFAFAGRHISPGDHKTAGGWPAVLRNAPTVWESFKLVAA